MKRETTPRVRDAMTPAPMTVRPETTVAELLGLFERHNFNGLPVVDAERVLRGMVTKLDLLRLLRPDQDQELPSLPTVLELKVAGLMRHGTVTTEPNEDLAVAADMMVMTGLRSLPVVQRVSGRPVVVGIVSRGDLLRGLSKELARREARPATPSAAARHG